ncbi:hypothetical protein J6TS7_32420 [Paenibacillus dendritiformis]|nr:hypothetical protein J6TS7_32420 [Paenibacillus dendritiformis]
MLVQRIWFPIKEEYTSETAALPSGAKHLHIPYSSAFKSMREQGVGDIISDFSSLDIEKTGWNFFGYLRAGKYEQAALMFDTIHYQDFFFRDYSELKDYTDKLILFGTTFTRNDSLTTVLLNREITIREDSVKAHFELYYLDLKKPIELAILFKKNKSHHGSEGIWYIASHPEELMRKIKGDTS